MDSAQEKDEIEFIPAYKEVEDKKYSQKFIVGMTLILVASIFTGMGLMTVAEWMLFTGTVGAAYFGVNLAQKKMLS